MVEPQVSDAARRRLLGRRHRLTPSARTDDVEQIARSVVALHSTDPVSVHLSVLARMRNPDPEAVVHALYAERSLIRHHAMRRTLWVAAADIVALMHRSCTVKIAAAERRKTEKFLAESGLADPGPWLEAAEARVCRVLAERGPITARELGALLPDVARPLAMAVGKSYAGVQGAHSRVVTGLGFDAVAVRTRPVGTWINGQYSWARMQDWAPELHTEIQAHCGPAADDATADLREAQTDMAHRWLSRFGPGTMRDLSWWMGWTLGDTRAALRSCGATAVDTSVGAGWMVPDDAALAASGSGSDDEPWVALLPGLDPSVMGWKERDFYLPPGGERAWDAYGNAGPTIWVDGRVIGAWGQTATGEIRLSYFADVPVARRREVESRAEEMQEWLGGARIRWRFPGAINAELTAISEMD